MLFGRHIVELNATNNALVRRYAWGLDLSGSLSGAGGVGGLAWVTLHTASGPASGTHFTCYDGNGNIVALVSSTTGDVTARYEYGPFGEPIRISGPAASLNAFRFSTKRTENNIDLVLYEYRSYHPSLGRWLSRDPIEEVGGVSLYLTSKNNFFGNVDIIGTVVGNFQVLHSLPVRKFQFAGWSIRFRWSPPHNWLTNCAPCKKVVWIQKYSIELKSLVRDIEEGPITDWDETNFNKNSELWENGVYPRGSRPDSTEMWDDPSIMPLYNLLIYRFRATSCVKCISGLDAGEIYGCYDWGFTYNPSVWPDLFGGVFFGPYCYNEIANE
jgi:RHS repeat-associated protein